MGILENMDLDNIPDEVALPDGEYEVMILDAGEYLGKESGKTSIRVVLSVPGEVEAQDIFHYIALPQEGDDLKTVQRKQRRIRDFLAAFDLTKNMDYVDWQGHKSWAILKQENDRNGEPRNSVVRFLGRSDNTGATKTDIPF